MKKPVTQFDLAAAFKALDEIDYGTVESNPVKNSKKLNESLLKETCERITGRKLNIERLVEDYYDLDDEQDLNQAAEDREAEIAQAKLSRIEKIVDLDAKTADDLLPSYVGKVIVRCPQCMNMFYKNEEDIVKDEEDPTICNVNEPCQHCGNISGYEIIGKVDKLSPEDTAQLSGDEEVPAEGEEDLDLDLDVTEEEAPAEEGEATEEAPEEGADEDLDLDLDLDLEEPAQESLNASKAAKSDFESKNETENKTLNEDIDKDVKELDDKLKAHNDYIEYLKNEIVSANEALEKATNEEVKAAIQRKLDSLNADLEAALPDAVKTDTVVDETPVEDMPVEEVEETEVTEESLNKAKAAKSDFESENNSEAAKTLHESASGLAEANKYGRSDDEDYYAQDINDAVMQLKKTGHAEFWCRQGKDKADQVVKTFHDRYGKKAEYTIDDEYCTAKVVKEDLEESNTPAKDNTKDVLDKFAQNLGTDDKSTTPNKQAKVSTSKAGKTLDKFAQNLGEGAEEPLKESSVSQILAAFEASLDDDNFDAPVEESVNKAEVDETTVPEIASENKSINECGDNGEECKDGVCEPKPEGELDEAVAITIGIDEVDDQVVANGPADAMIIAEPEATAVYDQPEFPEIKIEPQEVENPFDQNFETPAEFVGDAEFDEPFEDPETEPDEVDDEVEDEPVDDEDESEEEVAEPDEEAEEESEDEENEEVEESLTEGVFDAVKHAAQKVGSAVKNAVVSTESRLANGFDGFFVEVKHANANVKPEIKYYSNYEEARRAAIGLSNLGDATQAKVFAKSKVDGQDTLIDGYVKGKQAGKGKAALKQALATADETNTIKSGTEKSTEQPKSDLDDNNKPAAQAAQAAQANTTQETTSAQAAPVTTTATTNTAEQQASAEQQAPAKKDTVKKNTNAVKALTQYKTVIKLLTDAGLDTSSLKANGKVTDKLRNLVKGLASSLTSANESLAEDLDSATDDAVAKLQQLADEATENPTEVPVEEPVEEGIVSAAGDVVNGVIDGAKELLADNAGDKAAAEEPESIKDAIRIDGATGGEEPKPDSAVEALVEDNNGVSDAEFEKMLNSKVFQDFNEEVNLDDIEDIDEESVNECTTNYLKEVYSNVDKFELTKADVTNGILVLEGLIKFHSGKTRNTTFGYNLATGKHLAFSGVNEDLAKNGQFNIQCSLNNKSLVVESLAYSHEVNGQLVEGLVHKN